MRTLISDVRHQIIDQAKMPKDKDRKTLENQLRQLMGEYGQAQEMLEESRMVHDVDFKGMAREPLVRESGIDKLVLTAGVACWQGNKDFQEDRYLIDIQLQSPEGRPIAGFCVCDGHSGALCVDFILEKLPGNLQKCISAKSSSDEKNLCEAVSEACLLTDQQFLETIARPEEKLDGTTMCLALVYTEGTRFRLLIANLGDSRAVVCRALPPDPLDPDKDRSRVMAVRLSDDHKPDREDERARIDAAGGVVEHQGVWRVFTPGPTLFGGRQLSRWGLAVSRAFGDLLLKEPERYGCVNVRPGGLVIATPEIRVIDLQPSEDRFLVLACDGIWDILSDQDAVAVCAGQAGAQLAASALVRHSFSGGSDDNLTALVLTWRPSEGVGVSV